jgi:hypothetical protein
VMGIPSFQIFDYRVRPAKRVERKMLCETLQHLAFFGSLKDCRYIGFGGTAFVDFVLFHKTLGISSMISIERRDDYQARFEFNKPYDCIEIEYGDSNDVLPRLSWSMRTIAWLDYDGRLTDSVLRDVAYITANAVSGSVLIVTVHGGAHKLPSPRPEDEREVAKLRVDKLRADIGPDKVPSDIKGRDLEGGAMAGTLRRLIMREIQSTLRDRNGLNPPGSKVKYKPLFNFRYRDQARMLTVGGILYNDGDEEILSLCRLDKLDYLRSDDTPCQLQVPVLTYPERCYLDKHLPKGTVFDAVGDIGLTQEDVQNYVGLYRHCPAFAEVEMT